MLWRVVGLYLRVITSLPDSLLNTHVLSNFGDTRLTA